MVFDLNDRRCQTPTVVSAPLAGYVGKWRDRDGGRVAASNSNRRLSPRSSTSTTQAYFEQWLSRHVSKDKSILQFEGREMDLHQLHCKAVFSGSYRMARVTLISIIR